MLSEGNAAQITGYDPQTQPAFHAVLPMIATSAPAKVPPQTRNSALDARAPAIAAFPAAGALQRLAFLRELARRRDGDQLHSCGREDLLGVGGMDASITRPFQNRDKRFAGKDLSRCLYASVEILLNQAVGLPPIWNGLP